MGGGIRSRQGKNPRRNRANLLSQCLDGRSHNILPETERLDSHLLDAFDLVHLANCWGGAFTGQELGLAGRLKTDEGVLAPGVGACAWNASG